MATVKPQLTLRQGQALVMTPQLQQSIKLLQLGALELQAYVAAELERNPLLEPEDGADHGEPAPQQLGEDSALAADHALERVEAAGPEAAELDVSAEAMWQADGEPGESGRWEGSGGSPFDEEGDQIEQTASNGASLRDHLYSQLRVAFTDPVDLLIGSRLIDLTDDAGYLPPMLGPVAVQLGCDESRLERTLAVMRGFEPTGVFARSLKECLALQLEERNRLDPAMAALLDHLDLLAARDLGRLKALCGVSGEDLTDMIAELKRLEPKPGRAFGAEPAPPVIPDVFVRPAVGGGWQVELNPDTLPKVMVNTAYFSMLIKGPRTPAEKNFLNDQLQSGNWLVRSLAQRAKTILSVARELVTQQGGFFASGIGAMRPLTLRDIATAIGVHESTVSRVVANKHLACPRGLYDLRYFFNAALPSSAGGEAHASEAVRYRIKAMIDAEPPGRILSDDHIAAILSRSGVAIARRTVAKYRESLRIPSSVERRRLKRPSHAGADSIT